MENNLRRCKKCLLPETHETILFDEEGICNICRQNEFKNEKLTDKDFRIYLISNY